MAETVTLEKRETRRYKDHWAHLDRWNPNDTITVKFLKGRRFTEWERLKREGRDPEKEYIDGSEAGISVFNVVIKRPRNIDRYDLLQRLSDYLNYGGCDHAHDCCGCMSGSVVWSESRRIRRNVWHVVMSHSRNL